jgi:hypothetical protein
MQKYFIIPFLFFFCTLTLIAKAKGDNPDAVLHGYVTDAVTKKPVSGVVVFVSAPGISVSKEVTTNEEGYYSFEQLPAKQVDLRFGKKGYKIFKRVNIPVKEKASVKISVEFLPEVDDSDTGQSDFPLLRLLQME